MIWVLTLYTERYIIMPMENQDNKNKILNMVSNLKNKSNDENYLE